MSKKQIMIMALAAVIAFGGAFAFSWFTSTGPRTAGAESGSEADSKDPEQSEFSSTSVSPNSPPGTRMGMSEKQLKMLVYSLREKVKEYETKIAGIKDRERQLDSAHETFRKDIQRLEKLRTDLAGAVARLKEERSKLEAMQLKIKDSEKANLNSIAQTYDRMDSESAAKIFINMSEMRGGPSARVSYNDVVKILYYMSDRTKAKVLEEVANSEPQLAARLSAELKWIEEES